MVDDLPGCTRTDCSDSDRRSPWSRKLILSLDGGGIKGYSSLLMIKRLMHLVEWIERGILPADKDGFPTVVDPDPHDGRYYLQNDSSEEYRWNSMQRVHPDARKPWPQSTQRGRIPTVEETFGESYKCTEFKPHNYFDYIFGTSTGGLSAIMLGRMELNVEKALQHYNTVGDQVFGKPRFLAKHVPGVSLLQSVYASRSMERALQEVIKEALKDEIPIYRHRMAEKVPFESDPNRCRIVVVSHGGTGGPSRLAYLFRSYDHLHPLSPDKDIQKWHLNPGLAHREPIWVAARATSAAPTYFAPQVSEQGTFKDGGIIANNPAQVAWEEVRLLHEQKPLLLLSIGTGKRDDLPDTLDQSPTNRIKNWRNMGKLLIDLATESEKIHEGIEKTLKLTNDSDAPDKLRYHRLNVNKGVGDVPLDEWEPKVGGRNTKDKILRFTAAYLKQSGMDDQLMEIARKLVQIRRQRARSERWEQYACRLAYFCPEKSCRTQGRTFLTRDALRQHALEAHSFVRNIEVRGHHSAKHACFWDECQHDGVGVFDDQHSYKQHLDQQHQIDHIRFEDRNALEKWLDEGTITQKEAFERRWTEIERLEAIRNSQPASARTSSAKPASSAASSSEAPDTVTGAEELENGTLSPLSRRHRALDRFSSLKRRRDTSPRSTSSEPLSLTAQDGAVDGGAVAGVVDSLAERPVGRIVHAQSCPA